MRIENRYFYAQTGAEFQRDEVRSKPLITRQSTLQDFFATCTRFSSMIMPLKCTHLLKLVVFAFAPTGLAHAEEGDGFTATIVESIRHDSNLLRLSSADNVQARTGKSSAADTILTSSLFGNFNKSYGLQHVDLNAQFVNYRYQNFNYLNFSALNYRAAWLWNYTPHLYGNITTSKEQSINSFADSQNLFQRNERVDRSTRIDSTYELDARWRVLGALSDSGQTNRQPLITESSSTQTTAELGLRYVMPSGSFASFTTRLADGTYTDQPASALNLIDSGFTQSEGEAEVLWSISSKTNLDVKLGYKNRKHPNFYQRDFNAVVGSTRLDWSMTAKSAISIGWTRDIAAYQTSNTNYTQIDQLNIGPYWQFSPKTRIGLQFSGIARDYGGNPGLGTPSSRRDINRETTITVDWQPQRSIKLMASWIAAKRNSNVAGQDFNANIATITARFTF